MEMINGQKCSNEDVYASATSGTHSIATPKTEYLDYEL